MVTLQEFEARFPDEAACRDLVVALRWPDGVRCVRCGSQRVFRVTFRWAWQCKGCHPQGYRFSPLVGTLFENTSCPLRTWFKALFLMCESREGISALELHSALGGSYRTAWYLCQRVRGALRDESVQTVLGIARVGEALGAGDPRAELRLSRVLQAAARPRLPRGIAGS
jgi:hypothetical protein